MSGQSGQAIVEFLALGAALSLALLLPIGNGPSIATLLLETLLGVLRAQAFLISIV